ncbi:MAG: hypothetical protein AAGC57_13530 [Pseudomonadota bacterium]
MVKITQLIDEVTLDQKTTMGMILDLTAALTYSLPHASTEIAPIMLTAGSGKSDAKLRASRNLATRVIC